MVKILMIIYNFNKMYLYVQHILFKKEEPKFEKPAGYKNINSSSTKSN